MKERRCIHRFEREGSESWGVKDEKILLVEEYMFALPVFGVSSIRVHYLSRL